MFKFAVISVFIILSVMFVSGCTQNDTSGTGQITGKISEEPEVYLPKTPDPGNIDIFSGVKEGDLIRFYFTFNDRVSHEGSVNIKIDDSTGKELYNTRFNVKASQFVDYQFQLTGNPIGKAYEWKLAYNSIPKGMSSMGTAYLTFTTLNGKILTADTSLFDLRAYTDEEIEQMYEDRYIQNAKTSDKVAKKGNFEVKLLRYGYFTHRYSAWSEEETDFRIDIEVKNVGNEEDSFYTYDSALIIGEKQYDVGYDSEFDGGNIYPNIVKDGYIVFKDVPEDLSGEAKIMVGTHWVGYERTHYFFRIEI